ncbi:hypothetical protein MTO96_008880 [Rhipicephalus appendiculatus]
MPLPRREKTTYNDIRQPATDQVPHIPSAPPNPVCIRQSVQKYRDRVMPDWFQKVTEEADKCQKLKRGAGSLRQGGRRPIGSRTQGQIQGQRKIRQPRRVVARAKGKRSAKRKSKLKADKEAKEKLKTDKEAKENSEVVDESK